MIGRIYCILFQYTTKTPRQIVVIVVGVSVFEFRPTILIVARSLLTIALIEYEN